MRSGYYLSSQSEEGVLIVGSLKNLGLVAFARHCDFLLLVPGDDYGCSVEFRRPCWSISAFSDAFGVEEAGS